MGCISGLGLNHVCSRNDPRRVPTKGLRGSQGFRRTRPGSPKQGLMEDSTGPRLERGRHGAGGQQEGAARSWTWSVREEPSPRKQIQDGGQGAFPESTYDRGQGTATAAGRDSPPESPRRRHSPISVFKHWPEAVSQIRLQRKNGKFSQSKSGQAARGVPAPKQTLILRLTHSEPYFSFLYCSAPSFLRQRGPPAPRGQNGCRAHRTPAALTGPRAHRAPRTPRSRRAHRAPRVLMRSATGGVVTVTGTTEATAEGAWSPACSPARAIQACGCSGVSAQLEHRMVSSGCSSSSGARERTRGAAAPERTCQFERICDFRPRKRLQQQTRVACPSTAQMPSSGDTGSQGAT